MTWRVGGFGGGETRDALIEGIDGTGSNPILGSGWGIITSPVKNGTGAIRIPAGNAAYKTLLLNVSNNEILCLEAWVNFDGNPAVAHPALMEVEDDTRSNGYYLQVGTDRRVRIWGELMVNVTFYHQGPLTPWSEGVLGNGAYTHLVWFLDPLTLGTNNTLMTVLIDGVVQLQADVGAWPYWLGGGSEDTAKLNGYAAVAVDVRLDDIVGLRSTDKADAPHLAAAPIVKVAAQHPNAEGANLDWGIVPNDGLSKYLKWDDATGNDGDTTYLFTSGPNSHQDSDFQSAADLGWGGSAVVLESAAGVGPVWSVIHKQTSGTKWNALTLCNLAADISLVSPGTSYEAVLKRLTRTSGSWTDDDLATITAGAQTGTSDHDKNWCITTLMLQWAYYDTTLALTPAPMIPQSCMF